MRSGPLPHNLRNHETIFKDISTHAIDPSSNKQMRTASKMNLNINHLFIIFFLVVVCSWSSCSPSLVHAAKSSIIRSNDNILDSTTSIIPCLGSCENGVDGINKVCRFDFKVNLFAGELGYFQVDQCGDDPNPTLGFEKGVTYIFSQEVRSTLLS